MKFLVISQYLQGKLQRFQDYRILYVFFTIVQFKKAARCFAFAFYDAAKAAKKSFPQADRAIGIKQFYKHDRLK